MILAATFSAVAVLLAGLLIYDLVYGGRKDGD